MIVTQEEFQRIAAQAEMEYPNECCGAVLVKDSSPEGRVFLAFRNVQDELHAREPDRFPRTARTAFNIGLAEYRVLDDLIGKGYRPIIYHSHIDVGAYFSAMDKQMACPLGEPVYPNAIYLVVSVIQGKVAEANAFSWDPEQRDFPAIQFQDP
jgi:adenylyltransferase/sulfurtransferase